MTTEGGQEQRIRAVLLIGDELTAAHAAPSTKAAIAEYLWGLPWLSLDVTGDWDALRWERVAPYDVVIQYSGGRRHAATPEQVAGITRFVERGGGYVPLHFTSANAHDDFITLVGARFVNHPPFGPFKVRVSDGNHPITQGLHGFDIEDECYRSEFPNRGALRVLLTSHHPDPETKLDGEPSAWVREVGQGRVFYSALGHDDRVWTNEHLRELISRGIRWAARVEPVAPPAPPAPAAS